MARDFNGSTQYIEVDSAVLTGVALTIACWFNPDSDAANAILVDIVNKSEGDRYFMLGAFGAEAGDPVQAEARQASSGVARSSTGYTVGTWHHAAGVFTSATSRAAYIDGGSKATNSTNITPVGLDRTSIGRLGRATPAGYFDGQIAEVGIWNVALTDAEITVLAAGFSPLFVRPESLVLYAPLVRETNDIVGAIGLANSGTTVADHPRILHRSTLGPVISPAISSVTPYGEITWAIDPDDYPSGAAFYFRACLKVTSGSSATARLYNITDGAVVANSEVSTGNASLVELISGAITLPSGSKVYRAEQGRPAGSTGNMKAAGVLVKT